MAKFNNNEIQEIIKTGKSILQGKIEEFENEFLDYVAHNFDFETNRGEKIKQIKDKINGIELNLLKGIK